MKSFEKRTIFIRNELLGTHTKTAYQVSLVGPEWFAELGWAILAAVARLIAANCRLCWTGMVDRIEIDELALSAPDQSA